jgi:hypothetical protein
MSFVERTPLYGKEKSLKKEKENENEKIYP